MREQDERQTPSKEDTNADGTAVNEGFAGDGTQQDDEASAESEGMGTAPNDQD